MARRGTEYRILDKDLNRLSNAGFAQVQAARPVLAIGAGLIFIAAATLLAIGVYGGQPHLAMIAATIAVAAYLALSIGSNDVANSLAPAVGSGAVPLVAGLMIVAAAEVAGALLAGDAVSDRIAGGIIQPGAVSDAVMTAGLPQVMLSALLGAAVWISFASWRGLPVSTTQSIIGGIAGAGLVAFGPGAFVWDSIAVIALGWVVAPLLAGLIAAGMLSLIRMMVNEAADPAKAARVWLPALIALMTALFVLYLGLLIIGLSPVIVVAAAGLTALAVQVWATRRLTDEIADQSGDKLAIKRLFSLPLLWAAALMGFAHGANDAANVAGPLSVILHGTILSGRAVDLPFLALLLAGVGIALGTILFGGRLVQMVGTGITRLNPVRAFCISAGTATTILAASMIGLPVSSTHVAVGGVFGVGFFREWYDRRRRKGRDALPAAEYRRRLLVRRSYLTTIIAAWLITVPAAALLSAAVQSASQWLLGG
ncbi:inorganic phosphate transporter [Paracoccus tegillarcae]|uniref:Phosphate transporter n=1 Tax=Paracoccus tegillarcae TaxID=1529068 RepID=A0A2K9EEG0_9RHOB|nr:inorganic phosphate transporter [Paracoccus tegillarcae]AUH32699.1 inorganic phosphate transporter [Paracoccus tegillarcae]